MYLELSSPRTINFSSTYGLIFILGLLDKVCDIRVYSYVQTYNCCVAHPHRYQLTCDGYFLEYQFVVDVWID